MKKQKIFMVMVIGISLLIPNCAFAASEVETVATALENTDETKAHDYEYKKEYKCSHKVLEKYIGLASGQNTSGTVFGNKGGFYYSETGGTDVSISISVSYGPISVSVDPGTVKKSGGIFIESPYIGKACWLHVWKDVEVIEYDIYRKMAGTSQNWQYYDTETELVTGKSYYGVYDTKSEPAKKP